MICTTGTLARRIATSTVLDAEIIRCRANMVWNGQGIFRGVGLLTVAANTAVGQCALFAWSVTAYA